jgi:hypothetical protein
MKEKELYPGEKVKDRQHEKANITRLEELEDVALIVKTPEGQRFFKRLFMLAKLTDISMSGNSWTFFNEGQRNVVKPIWEDLAEKEPEITAAMFVEILRGK